MTPLDELDELDEPDELDELDDVDELDEPDELDELPAPPPPWAGLLWPSGSASRAPQAAAIAAMIEEEKRSFTDDRIGPSYQLRER